MDLVHELCPVQLLEVTKKSDSLSGWLASIQHLTYVQRVQWLPVCCRWCPTWCKSTSQLPRCKGKTSCSWPQTSIFQVSCAQMDIELGSRLIKQRQIIIRADEQYCLNILIRFIPLPCLGAVDWVMMQSCFGHHFMLVLEKQEKFDGHQQFFAIVQLIGTRKQAENFAYR